MNNWSGEWLSGYSMALWILALVFGMVWGMAVGFELIGVVTRHPRMVVFFRVFVCLLASFWIRGRYDLYKHRLVSK